MAAILRGKTCAIQKQPLKMATVAWNEVMCTGLLYLGDPYIKQGGSTLTSIHRPHLDIIVFTHFQHEELFISCWGDTPPSHVTTAQQVGEGVDGEDRYLS